MQRNKPQYLLSDDRQRDRWMFSYTDIVTILLILFVSVAAKTLQSNHLKQFRQQAAQSAPQQSSSLLKIQDTLRKHGIEPKFEGRGLVITLPQAILFSSGDDQISESALPIISQIAAAIRETDHQVQLVGHADNVPIHNRRFANNWELSAARSLRLLEVLTDRYGISESRLSVMSRGSQAPRDSNDTQTGRAENRRVEIVIVDKAAQPKVNQAGVSGW